MRALLGQSALRFYRQRPWQLALALIGIGLGVAVYVGVDIANVGASRAFELSAQTVRGQTTHRLLPIGGELDEAVYRELVVERGLKAAPVIEADVSIRGSRGLRVTLLGIDPIEEAGFRDYSTFVPGRASNLIDLLTQPATVLVPEDVAASLGLTVGSSFVLDAGAGPRRVMSVGTVSATGAGGASALPLVTDIATAQELTDTLGKLSRIDLRLDDTQARALADNLPASTALVAATGEERGFGELTRAFAINLTALGLLALVVGMFLIYSTMSFAVVQRRRAIGMLRAIGVSRAQLVESILLEAACLGAVGTLIGLALGYLLARTLMDMVLATVSDFTFSASVRDATLPPWVYARGAVLGIAATLIASLGPLRDATHVSPDAAMQRSNLERRARLHTKFAAAFAALALLAAAAALIVNERSLILAFAGLFFVLAAGAALTPTATVLLARVLEPVTKRLAATPGLLGARGIATTLSRTGVAASALAVAVATVMGVGLMIESFRGSLIEWLDTTLTADVYVNSADDRPIPEALLAEIASIDGVAGLSRTRSVRLPTDYGTLGLRAVEPGPKGWGLDIVDGDAAATIAALESGSGIAISEPYAYRRELERGDVVELPARDGIEAFRVAGIFRDYNTVGRAIVMSLDTYRREWADTAISSVGVQIAPQADLTRVETSIRAVLRGHRGLGMRSTRMIRQISLLVFDRTFRITEVLRILAAIVAFLGILSALLAIQLERVREFSILRVLGFTPSNLRSMILTETGLLGLAAGLMAVPIGSVLAALLVHVINRRSFGWTMHLALGPQPILLGVALAVGAALLAGLYPARAAARGAPGVGLRDE